MHRRIAAMPVALLSTFALAAPAAAERSVYNNWHIHSGLPGHAGAGIFPAVLGVSLSEYQSRSDLWAHCPNATDKPLLNDGVVTGHVTAAGVCMNDHHVIQLRVIPFDAPAPAGWTVVRAGSPTQSAIYVLLTERG